MWPSDDGEGCMRTRDPRSPAGFTLVELMIAISLMLIITLQLNIIFNQSRKLFIAADAMVQVFQNARSALELLERDIANVQKTSQMEFFKDDIQRFPYGFRIFNEGEQITGIQPRFFPGVDYIYGLALKERRYDPKDRKEGKDYRRDAIYFRAMTMIDGTPKDALIQYELDIGPQPSNPLPRPILRRTLWEVEKIAVGGDPVIKKHAAQDICYYATEFKAEVFIRDKRKNGMGRFYGAKEATVAPPAGDPQPPNLRRYDTGDSYGIMCVARNEPNNWATLLTAAAQPPAGGGPSGNYLEIPGERLAPLAAGDKMYLLVEPDPGSNAREDFGGPLTISKIDATQGGAARVWFEEAGLIAQKLGKKRKDGVPRVNVDWRAAWLPPAIRVTLKIKDARSEEIRTIERIFQILKS